MRVPTIDVIAIAIASKKLVCRREIEQFSSISLDPISEFRRREMLTIRILAENVNFELKTNSVSN